MDFALSFSDGRADLTWSKAETLLNSVYLSLVIRRGAWWFNPGFGSRLHELRKNVPRAETEAEQLCREALQWLLDTGRARSIDVTAERERTVDLHRLRLLVEVTQADGRRVTFETFQEVV